MSLQAVRFITNIVDAFLPFLGAFIILGEDLKKFWFKTFVYSIIYGSIMFFTDNISIDIVRVLSNVTISFLLLKYIFRLTNWFVVKMFVTACLLGFSANVITYLTTQYGFKVPIKRALLDKSMWLKVFLPGEFLNLPLAFMIRRVRDKFQNFFANIQDNLNVIRSLGLLIIVQVSLLISLIVDITSDININASLFKTGYILLSVFVLIGLNILILNKSISISAAKTLEAAQDTISDNIMGLVNSVSSQRHDFINHVQVLSSLLQLGKIEDLRTYLSQLSSEISVYDNVLKADNPIIGALLNAKIAQAGLKDIKLQIDIKASLQGINSKVLELTRILGNLINNSIDAVERLNSPDRWIKLQISEKGPSLVFIISNPGQAPAKSAVKLFEPGFTTKDDSHSGLGLYVCKQLADKMHGSINYSYDPLSGISFSLVLPKS